MSSSLVSLGYPENWTKDDVVRMGVLDNGFNLSERKVGEFSSFAAENYTETKKILGSIHDYQIFFQDRNNQTVIINGTSSIGLDYSLQDPEKSVKIVRFVFYDSEIIRMVLYLW